MIQQLTFRFLFPALWLLWGMYWWLSSLKVKHTQREEPLASRLLHLLPLFLSFALLWVDHLPGNLLNERLFPWALWQFWFAAAITAGGMAFSVWARLHIGRNWSGTVTIKEDHELITTGPYALVRHPIYTGLLLAILGSAFARGDLRGPLAVLIAWASLWRKLLLEERWMLELFGERYAAYCRQVPALIPFAGRT